MTNEQILETLRDIFRDVLDDETLEVTSKTSQSNTEEWDSLAHITLIAAIEQAFKIKFTMTDIMEAIDVSTIAEQIRSKA